MWVSENWKDYELLDCSDGERLERWGKYILVRPDPQVVWVGRKKHKAWKCPDATYERSKSGGGTWKESRLPEEWNVNYDNYRFSVKPMGFKHTGLFPEQAANWEWFAPLIRDAGRKIKVLNLFAYTGGATVAAAKAGAEVCHVDAAKNMVERAKKNMELSGLSDAPVRYIVDDCKKFCEREKRRGNFYDAVIMDPPSYGRGPGGEMWKLEESIDSLIRLTVSLLSEKPLFFLINSYTAGLSPSAMGYILQEELAGKYGGNVVSGEIGIPVSQTGGILPCGGSARWQTD